MVEYCPKILASKEKATTTTTATIFSTNTDRYLIFNNKNEHF